MVNGSLFIGRRIGLRRRSLLLALLRYFVVDQVGALLFLVVWEDLVQGLLLFLEQVESVFSGFEFFFGGLQRVFGLFDFFLCVGDGFLTVISGIPFFHLGDGGLGLGDLIVVEVEFLLYLGDLWPAGPEAGGF